MKSEHIHYGCLEFDDELREYVFCSSAHQEDFDNLKFVMEFDDETHTSEIKSVEILRKAQE